MRAPKPAANQQRETDLIADDADEALMMAFAGGDLSAFETLYGRHERPVYRYLLRSVSIPALAEELLQEIWLNVVRGAPSYEARAKFTTWLYSIARTRLIDHWRARDKTVLRQLGRADDAIDYDEIPGEEQMQPEIIAMNRAQARAFVLAVEQLPPAQREVFMLHADAGLTIGEIAVLTGVATETAKSRFRYACASLRRQLHEWHPR